MIVVMGERALATLNELQLPLAAELERLTGQVQHLTPGIDAIYVPDIDESLDDQQLKEAFWKAFRAVGDWYADLPPY
jgi:uracil-DNA glycosylase